MNNEYTKRQQEIDKGKIWQVYEDFDADSLLFEGSKSACISWAKKNCPVQYNYGKVRVRKLIYENNDKK